MPRERVDDPADPRFPHGTRTGYVKGCRKKTYKCPVTPSCTDATARLKVRRKLRDLAGETSPNDNVPSGPVLVVLDRITEAGIPMRRLAEATGLYPSNLQRIRYDRPPWIKRRNADAVMAAQDRVLAAPPRYVPSEHALRIFECLAAQGFTVKWVQQQLGRAGHRTVRRGQSNVWGGKLAELTTLADSLREVTATPELIGAPQSVINRTLARAAKEGWRPLDLRFDDDWTYNPRLDPEHPWSIADSRCSEILAIAARLVRDGRDPTEEPHRVIAEQRETFVEEVERIAKKLGVGPRTADREANAARVREAIVGWDTGALDVVRAAVDLGLAEWDNNGGLVPRGHPAIADLVAKADEERATRRAAYRQRQNALKREQKRRRRRENQAAQRTQGQVA